MPWRLIEFIIIFVVFLVFIVFNLENKCDINFGFRQIKDVPVFITAFSAFIFGMFCAMPFIFGFRAKKKARDTKKGNSGQALQKRRETKGGDSAGTDSGFSGDGSYGID
ncbi:MAG: hypothetical protein LBD48_14065 [Treponema sp.]|jgi:uncharacterized integral membrane protein|nr:hypothetical protein [Treponema sp.]